MRGKGNAIRYYIDIDDRMAAEILNRSVMGVPVVAEDLHETAQLMPSPGRSDEG